MKWFTEIELIGQPFTAYYQTEKYWYEWKRDGRLVREPVTLQRVRALITEPAFNQQVLCGELTIRGVAWSGAAPIARVEVSVGEGDWREARMEGESQCGSWRRWELITRLDQAGASDMRARATDQAGNTQLLACGYSAQCTVRGCRARATVLARYTDGQGRPLKQRELRKLSLCWCSDAKHK